MRCTRIFSPTERTARMTERVNKQEGFKHTRIDKVVDPSEHEPHFYVLADDKPIEGIIIPGAFPIEGRTAAR